MSKAVLCLTNTTEQAGTIVDELRVAGFSNDDISVLYPDKGGSHDLGHEGSSKAPEGAATGVGVGGAVGGTLGLLAGIGMLAIPGIGPFIAAGPIMAALGGAAIGATVGGISGTLVGLGIPEYEAKQYEGKIKEGKILISVHTEDGKEQDRAREVFKANHAEDIGTVDEKSMSSR